MILVSTGNKELHSETSLDGIRSSGHDFSDEFLINVMTSSSVKMFQGCEVSRFLFAMIAYNVSDLLKKIQKIVKKAMKPIKKL